MAARRPPEQAPAGTVSPARMGQWYDLKREQESTRSEFERRVTDARRQLLERHAREERAFWTGQPYDAWQPPANSNPPSRAPNGQAGTHKQQVPQRPAEEAALPGSRNPAQKQGDSSQGLAKGSANLPKSNAANTIRPAAAPARPSAAVQQQGKPFAKAHPQSRTKPAPKKQVEFVDLCSDDETEQPRPATAASRQPKEFNPPGPSGVLSFFGDGSKVSRPIVKDEEDIGNHQFHASSNAPVSSDVQMGNTQVTTNGPPLSSTPIRNAVEQNGIRSATAMPNDSLPCHEGQNQASGLGKACERSEEDVNMKDAPAEAEPPQYSVNIPDHSQSRSAQLSDHKHDHRDAEKANRDARAEYEKKRQHFPAIKQTNGKLSDAERSEWIEISEAETKRAEEEERTLRCLRALETQIPLESDVWDRGMKNGFDGERPQQVAINESIVEKPTGELHQSDGSTESMDTSSHQRLNGSHRSTQFKVPQVPRRAIPTNERTRREGTITSRASCQILPGHSTLSTDKDRPNPVPLPTPPQSEVSSTRKRKVHHDVSDDSDDDPEFESPSSDDEPLLNRVRKPGTKKAKAINSSDTARPLSTTPKYGFKSVKLKLSNSFRPLPPPRPTSRATVATTPAPSARPKHSSRALGSESPSVQAAQRSSSRRAKQKALAALDEHYQKDEEFRAEEDIREADEREQRLTNALPAGTQATLRKTLQRMSLTPVPPSARLAAGRTGTAGAHDAGGGDGGSAQKGRRDSVYGLDHWTEDRKGGDRQVLKSRSGSSLGRGDEESESELDLSGYKWVNGRIVSRGEEREVEEVDMMD